jgi:hypothetical protein
MYSPQKLFIRVSKNNSLTLLFIFFFSVNGYSKVGLHMSQVYLIKDYKLKLKNQFDSQSKFSNLRDFELNEENIKVVHRKQISAIEIDVTYLDNKNASQENLYVSYGIVDKKQKLTRFQTFSNHLLSLPLYLKKISSLLSLKFVWIDLKNLTENNAEEVCKIYKEKIKDISLDTNIYIESQNLPALKILYKSGCKKVIYWTRMSKISSITGLNFWKFLGDIYSISPVILSQDLKEKKKLESSFYLMNLFSLVHFSYWTNHMPPEKIKSNVNYNSEDNIILMDLHVIEEI